MQNTLLTTINEKLPKLSKGHRKIAEYILAHYDKAAFMTASRLGNVVGVSESTVVRFAIELGFEGYPEMQKSLKEFTSNKLTTVQRMEVMNDQLAGEDVLSKILNFDIEQIRRTMEEIDKDEFYTTVDTISRADRIYVIGARSASVLARFIVFYFNIMFENVKIIHTTSTSEMFEQILGIGEKDIMIGISFPRYSKHTIKAFKYAKDNGAKVIAITDTKASPLAQYADHLLLAHSDMASFADSLVAPMSLINALITAVGLQRKEYVSDSFQRLETIWDKYEVYEKTETNEESIPHDKIN
ncbi:MAG: MurR/RpiR family transcriptional regulator [Oscillospiraceae bacterium]|nr:MurR/RpiR family transcriptional regulator [Oscillospiraceae bacterium]